MKNFFGRVFSTVLGNLFTIILVFLFFGILVSIIGAFSSIGSGESVDKNSVLELRFEDPIFESSMQVEPNPFELEPSSPNYYLNYLEAIDAAAKDDKIKGISLKVDGFNGDITHLVSIKKKLAAFKKTGKFIYAYSENATQGGYYLATLADSIYQNPLGSIDLKGLSANVMFFKNFGEKYGLDFQVIRHGEYKAAVEPYIREDLSDENREQLGAVISDIWTRMSSDMAENRKIDVAEFQSDVDSLIGMHPDKLLKKKYIDAIRTETEYDKRIAGLLGLESKEGDDFYEELNDHIVGLNFYTDQLEKKTGSDEIAVLYAAGTIDLGDGFDGIQSDLYKKEIRKLRFDDDVKAVVFRINSGGGSAQASEDILFEIRKLKEVKPVVVSFGDVAASGGYYIAMAADSIISNPQTITGSIGVLGMIPNLNKLAANNGITVDYVNTNENSHFLRSMFLPLSPEAMQQLEVGVSQTYDRFVNHVAKARGMTYTQVDSIARGRIWTGNQALEIGLVDSHGDLPEAIAAAAKLAKLSDYGLKSVPYRKEGLEEFLSKYNVQNTQAALKRELGTEAYATYQKIKNLKSQKGIQLVTPFSLDFEF